MLKFTKRRNGGMYATIRCEFNVGINDIANIIYNKRYTPEELNQLNKVEIEEQVRLTIQTGGDNELWVDRDSIDDGQPEDLATYDQCLEYVKKMFIKE